MKTFKDVVLKSENPMTVLQMFYVNGVGIALTAKDFQSVLQDDISNSVHNSYVRQNGQPTLIVSLKKLNDNELSITVTNECECGGCGEVDCPSCDGTGEHYCDDCGTYHDCARCDGTGGQECEMCKDDIFDTEEILYEKTILLNQGELF